MNTLKRIWTWIEYNRFTVITLVLSGFLSIAAYTCTPLTSSPIEPIRLVDDTGLKLDLKEWQQKNELILLKFENAGADLQAQKERQAQVIDLITKLATGDIPDIPSALKLFILGGGLGAIVDNIRKRGLIAGLKKNGNKTA